MIHEKKNSFCCTQRLPDKMLEEFMDKEQNV